MKKKVIAIALYMALLLTSVFPATALAEGETEDGTPQEAPVCSCTTKCAEDVVDSDCPICSAAGADLSACKGQEPQPMNERSGGNTLPAAGQGDGLDTPDPMATNTPACTCTARCSDGAVNEQCPVCGAAGADLSACTGKTEESGGLVPDNEPEPVTVTDWSWVDEKTVLASDGKLYLPSAVTADNLEGIKALLPQSIMAAGQSIGPLSWTYEEGTGTFTAALPEGYALAEGARPLTVETVNMWADTLEEKVVTYRDASGMEQTVTATLVTADDTAWDDTVTNGWYVAEGNVAIDSRITVTGSVKLILTDGCSLIVNGGIGVNGSNSFTIYGQTGGTGSLNADAYDIISPGAGIGSATGSSGGTITINGGTVSAAASGGSAAIGDGFSAGGGSIIINGGTVSAAVTGSAAAIGSSSSNGGNCSITVSGGTVTATVSGGGAAIGDGLYSGGSTFSTGNNGTALIYATGGNGADAISDQSGKNGWSGIIFENGVGAVYGNQTNSGSFTIADGQSLDILSGSVLTNDGALTIAGVLTNKGTFNNNGPVTVPMHGNFSDEGTLNCTYHSYDNDICVICGARLVLVAGIQLNPSPLNLCVGSTATLQATVSPDNAPNKTLSWSSSAPGVAGVDPVTGVVTALSAGQAIITAFATDGSNVKGECTVTVYPAATRVEISNADLGLRKGESYTLGATVYPKEALQTISWSSSAPDVASVDPVTGVVTAHKAGTAIITATATDGSGKKATCTVTVDALVSSVTMSRSSLRIYEGRGYTLSASVSPQDATDKTLIWSSSDSSIATVDQNGNVTGKAPGVCTIYATAADGGGAAASCTVRVLHWYPGATPITGDSSNLGLWIGVLAVSVVAIGVAAIILVKKRKKK